MVTFTEEILNEKLHFSCCDRKMSVKYSILLMGQKGASYN